MGKLDNIFLIFNYLLISRKKRVFGHKKNTAAGLRFEDRNPISISKVRIRTLMSKTDLIEGLIDAIPDISCGDTQSCFSQVLPCFEA